MASSTGGLFHVFYNNHQMLASEVTPPSSKSVEEA
jgi:hypothetical protein